MKYRKKINYNLVVVLIVFITYIMLKNIGNRMLYNIENIVIKNVNKAIYNYVFYTFNDNELGDENLLKIIYLHKNEDGEIISIDYRFDIAYEYLNEGMNELYKNITNIDFDYYYEYDKNNVYYLPVGLANDNLIFENIGFKIPCKINFISDIDMGFKTKVVNYGVNNLLMELYLVIDVNNSIMSPSSYKEFGEYYEIVVASKVIVGKIPNYYGGVIEQSSSIVSS